MHGNVALAVGFIQRTGIRYGLIQCVSCFVVVPIGRIPEKIDAVFRTTRITRLLLPPFFIGERFTTGPGKGPLLSARRNTDAIGQTDPGVFTSPGQSVNKLVFGGAMDGSQIASNTIELKSSGLLKRISPLHFCETGLIDIPGTARAKRSLDWIQAVWILCDRKRSQQETKEDRTPNGLVIHGFPL